MELGKSESGLLKVPRFSGAHLKTFLYRMESVMELKKWNDAQMAIMVRTCFLDEAVLEELIEEPVEIQQSWMLMKKFLSENFGIEKEDESALLVKALMDIKQEVGEKGRQYVSRLRRANGELPKKLRMADDLLVAKAKIGMLQPMHALPYADSSILSLNDLARAMSKVESRSIGAVSYESMPIENGRRGSFNSRGVRSRGGRSSGLSRGAGSRVMECFNCGGKGHIASKCSSPRRGVTSEGISCYRCGQMGHMKNECSMKSDVCFNCGCEGHVARNCASQRG